MERAQNNSRRATWLVENADPTHVAVTNVGAAGNVEEDAHGVGQLLGIQRQEAHLRQGASPMFEEIHGRTMAGRCLDHRISRRSRQATGASSEDKIMSEACILP